MIKYSGMSDQVWPESVIKSSGIRIWETLSDEGQISFGYKAFRHYVLKLIKSEQEDTRDDKQSKSKNTNKIKGFTFNPIPNPEELL
ncbi:TraK family protein [Legionella pneumophila]|uniref:TraK family protein n=1 Tax=Legionella pneumophila TaxID=446 RepID=UPI000322014B|nr:TraK family protein [Legionella pneumophila]